MVISLKKYLDMDPNALPPSEPEEVLFAIVLQAYKAALLAVANNICQACPTVGAELQQQLQSLQGELSGKLTTPKITETETQVEEALQHWCHNSGEYLKGKVSEIKELLIVLARTAESVGERDQRYATRFTELTGQLQSIANLEDLHTVRASLVKSASELKTYVDQMTHESKQSVALLQAEVSTYESKLKVVEELALRDPLTGLSNRRNVEERIEWRIAHGQVFSLVVLDLNHFKAVNDTYGHLAGDSLLKQFSQELRGCVRSTDLVGRWSGDEFVIVLDCELASAQAQMDRVQNWVFGEYELKRAAGKPEVKVQVDAAIGMAMWHAGETLQQLIERADAAMYVNKKKAKKAKA